MRSHENNTAVKNKEEIMPQNTFQRIIFTAVMAIFMTYGMIVYNISTSLGQMSDIIFR